MRSKCKRYHTLHSARWTSASPATSSHHPHVPQPLSSSPPHLSLHFLQRVEQLQDLAVACVHSLAGGRTGVGGDGQYQKCAGFVAGASTYTVLVWEQPLYPMLVPAGLGPHLVDDAVRQELHLAAGVALCRAGTNGRQQVSRAAVHDLPTIFGQPPPSPSPTPCAVCLASATAGVCRPSSGTDAHRGLHPQPPPLAANWPARTSPTVVQHTHRSWLWHCPIHSYLSQNSKQQTRPILYPPLYSTRSWLWHWLYSATSPYSRAARACASYTCSKGKQTAENVEQLPHDRTPGRHKRAPRTPGGAFKRVKTAQHSTSVWGPC